MDQAHWPIALSLSFKFIEEGPWSYSASPLLFVPDPSWQSRRSASLPFPTPGMRIECVPTRALHHYLRGWRVCGTPSPDMCTYEQVGLTRYQVRMAMGSGWWCVPGKSGFQGGATQSLLPCTEKVPVVRGVTRYRVYPIKSSTFRLIGELKFLFNFNRRRAIEIN